MIVRDVIHAGKFCHIVCENYTSVMRLCSSVCQFLIYHTIVLVMLLCGEKRKIPGVGKGWN